MDNRLKILFLIPLLYFTQACQVLLPPMRVEAALPAPTTFIAPTTSVEPTAFVVLSPTPTQEPAPTPLPPTPLPTLEPAFIPPTETSAPEQIVEQALVLTPTVRPTASPVQLSVFEELWSTVKSDYLYRDFNGVPWDFVHEVYRYKIEAGLTNEEFYALMEEMIALLGDNHSTFLSPDIAGEHQAEFSGQTEYVGIGVMTEPVPEKKRVSIVAVFPDSPASEAGILPHDSILEVDGQPLVDDAGRVKSLLKGAEGSASVITVQTPGQEPRMVYIVRRKIAAAPPHALSCAAHTAG